MTETTRAADLIARAERASAHNYSPLPVVVEHGEGPWVWDVEGKRYLDMLAGYSALNFGHRHPTLVQAAHEQLDRLTMVSRAFHHDRYAEAVEKLARLTGKEAVLMMNSGAEAVETSIKLARRWGYEEKGVPSGKARIIVMDGNFHGRTTTIVSFSSDDDARNGYGPYTPGFTSVPYGDLAAAEKAMLPDVVAVLVEPVQGEAGVVIPPETFLPGLRSICDAYGILLIADEIQSGLGRCGARFASDLVGVEPDIYVLGKALGGGVLPVSAIAANRAVMDVFTPGTHGSTFGGNALACAMVSSVCDMLETGEWYEKARELSGILEEVEGPAVKELRVVGAWAGIDLDRPGRKVCEQLQEKGILAKETHGKTIRLSPPLVTEPEDLAWAVKELNTILG